MDRDVSPRSIAIVAIGVAVYVMCIAHGLPALSVMFLVIFVACVIRRQLKKVRAEWSHLRASLSERVGALVASVKSFYETPPLVNLVNSACMIFALATVILLFLFGKQVRFYFLYACVGLFLFAGGVEYVYRIVRILRNTWARAIGKLLLAGIGAIVYVIADAIARHVAVTLTQADPKFFPSFVRLVSLVLVPILYLYCIAFIAAVWSFLEIASVLILYHVLQIVDTIRRYVDNIHLVIKLSHGRAPASEKSEVALTDSATKDLIILAGRSLLFCFFTIAIMLAAEKLLEWHAGWVEKGLRYTLIKLEYNEQRICDAQKNDVCSTTGS